MTGIREFRQLSGAPIRIRARMTGQVVTVTGKVFRVATGIALIRRRDVLEGSTGDMSTTKPIMEGDKNAANDRFTSRVLEFGCAEPPVMAAAMLVNLRLHTDAWDLAEDLTRDEMSIVVLDVRPKKAYEEAHIPGARSFPHREMTESSTRTLDRSKVYVVYCDGIGCNGSTKGAYKLSSLGFQTKELLGGLDWWRRDGHSVLSGPAPGDIHQAKKLAKS